MGEDKSLQAIIHFYVVPCPEQKLSVFHLAKQDHSGIRSPIILTGDNMEKEEGTGKGPVAFTGMF